MKITEYLKNPVGKGSAIYPVKQMAEKYDARYESQKENISVKIYTFRGMIYYHFLVPSSEEGIKYDVLVEFRRLTRSSDISVKDMTFRVFSNCPSFVYTYAYAYNKQKLVIDTLQRTLIRRSITDKANIRNKYNVVGFEYSVYLALKYIIDNNIDKVAYINNNSEKIHIITRLYDKMQDFDSLMIRHKAAGKTRRSNQKEESKKIRARRIIQSRNNQTETKETKEVKDRKTTKQTKQTKPTRTAKGVKRK